MIFRIVYTPHADKQLDSLPKAIIQRILLRIERTASTGRSYEKIYGRLYKIRVGQYRVLFFIDEGVMIIRYIDHRSVFTKTYHKLSRNLSRIMMGRYIKERDLLIAMRSVLKQVAKNPSYVKDGNGRVREIILNASTRSEIVIEPVYHDEMTSEEKRMHKQALREFRQGKCIPWEEYIRERACHK